MRRIFKIFLFGSGLILGSTKLSYSLPFYARDPPDFPEYKKEINLIEKEDYTPFHEDPTCELYRKAYESIKKKQQRIGEGKDMKLDYMRVYTTYSISRGPAEPDTAEYFFKETIYLAEKYYKIWNRAEFLDLAALSYKHIGEGYFRTAEEARNCKGILVILEKPANSILYPYFKLTTRYILFELGTRSQIKNTLQVYYGYYGDFTIIFGKPYKPFYEKAKEYYEKFLEYYEENIKEKIEDIEEVKKSYEDFLQEVYDALKIINEVLEEE